VRPQGEQPPADLAAALAAQQLAVEALEVAEQARRSASPLCPS
jgi:hypothetical protein